MKPGVKIFTFLVRYNLLRKIDRAIIEHTNIGYTKKPPLSKIEIINESPISIQLPHFPKFEIWFPSFLLKMLDPGKQEFLES